MTRTTLALAIAVAAIPALAGAQQDSTRRNAERTERSRGGAVERSDRRSDNPANRWRGRNYGLDREQVRQLQEAIDDKTECNVGTADGVVGPKTRRAVSCARRELGIQGNDMGELFTALGLDFASDDPDAEVQADSTQGNRGNRANAGNRGRAGNRGNAGRDSTARDSSRGQAPGQQPPR